MNRRPLHAITPQLQQAYARDGVVCLRGMFDQQWVSALLQAAEAVVDAPADHGGIGYVHGPMTAVNFLYARPSIFRDFVFDSPLGEVIGRTIGSSTVRICHDYVFSKQAGCDKVIPWHTDGGGYSVDGAMMPNLWLALTPVDATNGRLEFAGGFFREFMDGKRPMPRGQHRSLLPDFDVEMERPGYPFPRLTWDLEPGDAVLFHPYTPHHSKANTSGFRRTGYALRVLGDDVVWDKAQTTWLQIPGLDFDSVKDGQPITQAALPIIWNEDGQAVPAHTVR